MEERKHAISWGSCETEVLTPGRDGREDLLAERFVAFVLGKIKLCLALVTIKEYIT